MKGYNIHMDVSSKASEKIREDQTSQQRSTNDYKQEDTAFIGNISDVLSSELLEEHWRHNPWCVDVHDTV